MYVQKHMNNHKFLLQNILETREKIRNIAKLRRRKKLSNTRQDDEEFKKKIL